MNELINNSVETVIDADEMNSTIGQADGFIRKQYLLDLKDASVVPLSAKLSNIQVGKNARMFKVTSLSFSEKDNVYDKITQIYSAVTEFDSSQILILDSDGNKVDLYLGVASNDTDNLSMQFETFKSSFLGNFPGGKISVLNTRKNEELLNSFFDEDIKISSVSALTTATEAKNGNLYGIEHLINAMYGKPFTMFIVSDAIAKSNVTALRQNLEALYTELTPFRDYSLSLNTNLSETYTQTFNLTKSESVTEGKSVTENTSFSKSKNKSSTTAINQEENQKRAARNQLLGAAVSMLALPAGGNILQGLFYGGSISNILGSAQTLMNGANLNDTETTGEGESYSLSFSESETTSQQKGFSSSKGISDGSTTANGKTISLKYENKSIIELLSLLDKQIARLQHIEEIGGFECAAYFITGDNSSALTVANMYRSLLGKGNSLGQNNAINVWSERNDVVGIGEYLKRLNHPVFQFERKPNFPSFKASTLISTDEFPMYASLPQKSMCGLPVSKHAEFARDIISMNVDNSDKLEIGRVYHMGKTENNKVHLSKNDLNGHMFVSGSTGAGKSNFCYGLLDGLYKKNVKFMVIEPAKGEYHKVFGGYSDVYSYGTNPNLMPLLKINPFSFPEDIHVNEHINRLLEIFNSCWPMYAAMPAVLKEAVETVYRNSGFNLITGKSKTPNKFPNFNDVLTILPEIIKKSEFSGEVKGNYIGSLMTRVKSLTDGLYGCIFTEDEIPNEKLFDENVLVDLSRVGSSETKALIMGIMVMKLQEYRTSKSQMNSPLKHITILEEAHHLLKSSTSSSAEGVNLRAMSLEMITNAIAEMRTYGEGFVIADQSPTLMDLSVIRNTNTKVVFKLPENSDRRAVGNAMSLNEEQINEISRLERGVAVVYQSNWDDAILAKINYFDTDNFKPYVHKETIEITDDRDIVSQCAAILIKNRLTAKDSSSVDVDICNNIISNSMYADKNMSECITVIKKYINESSFDMSFANVCKYIDRIIDTKKLIAYCKDENDMAQWDKKARAYITTKVSLSDAEQTELITLCLNIRTNDSPEMKKFYFRYFAFVKKTNQE